MKRLLFPALCLLSASVKAQYQFRFQVNAAALRTHLYNAGDNAASNLNINPQITPNGGFTFSWVNTEKSGFQGIQTGIGYLGYKQTTNGERDETREPFRSDAYTSSRLHYLSLPVEARFGLAQKGRFTPFVTVGFFTSRLLSYTEQSRTGLLERRSGDYVDKYTTFNNKDVAVYTEYMNIPFDRTDTKIKKGIYESWNFGLMASIGAEFELGHRHFISVRVPIRYSPTDAERKDPVEYQQGERPLYFTLPGQSYWTYNTPKGLYDQNFGLYNFLGPIQPTNNLPQRGTTHTFSYGLELSYGLRLISKKHY